MNEAVRIARETTLGPIAVQHYLDGGLDGEMIRAVHDLAATHNVTVGQVVEKLFSYDPVDGYQVRPHVARILIGRDIINGEGDGVPVGILGELGTRMGTRDADPKTPEPAT